MITLLTILTFFFVACAVAHRRDLLPWLVFFASSLISGMLVILLIISYYL